MNIIFTRLPRYLDFIPILIKKLNFQVFYISLTKDYEAVRDIHRNRAEKLKKNKVMPLPIDEIKDIDLPEFLPELHDKFAKEASEILNTKITTFFSRYFINVKDFHKKVYNNLITFIYDLIIPIFSRVLVWIDNKPNEKNIVICFSFKYFFIRKCIKFKNTKIIIIPFDDVEKIIRFALNRIKLFFKNIFFSNKKLNIKNFEKNLLDENVALIIHKLQAHAKLYRKDVYYSKEENSFLNESTLLHLDYSNNKNPPQDIKWINLKNLAVNKKKIIGNVVKFFFKSIIFIINPKTFLGWFFLFRVFVEYQFFYEKMKKFKNLKLALIDYDILCPKTLLFALESLNVTTLCAQNRYALPLYPSENFFYDYYLCSSDFIKNKIEISNRNIAKNCFVVGQPRTDNFLFKEEEKEKLITSILSKTNCSKIVTCLGFHTETDWFLAKPCNTTNWNAHKQFLRDMYNLSKKLPEVYFILRYKHLNWISINYFQDILQEINNSKNITLSNDYSKYNISYDLCSISNLVISLTSSLAQECLAHSIPVLIHDYTYNLKQLDSLLLDYKPLDIICSNFDELSSKTKKILQISQDQFENENKEGLNKYFLRTKKPGIKNKIQLIVNKVYEGLNV